MRIYCTSLNLKWTLAGSIYTGYLNVGTLISNNGCLSATVEIQHKKKKRKKNTKRDKTDGSEVARKEMLPMPRKVSVWHCTSVLASAPEEQGSGSRESGRSGYQRSRLWRPRSEWQQKKCRRKKQNEQIAYGLLHMLAKAQDINFHWFMQHN